MTLHPLTDPIERLVAEALVRAGIEYIQTDHTPDFYLPGFGVGIECKQFFTSRITRQLQDHPNTIVIQGIRAAEAFASMLSREPRDTQGDHGAPSKA